MKNICLLPCTLLNCDISQTPSSISSSILLYCSQMLDIDCILTVDEVLAFLGCYPHSTLPLLSLLHIFTSQFLANEFSCLPCCNQVIIWSVGATLYSMIFLFQQNLLLLDSILAFHSRLNHCSADIHLFPTP